MSPNESQLQLASGLAALLAFLTEGQIDWKARSTSWKAFLTEGQINQLDELVGNLQEKEADAICAFEAEGRRCLAALSQNTLDTLQMLKKLSSTSRKGTDANESPSYCEEVRNIFKRYDSNGDGFLSKAELRSVLRRLNNASFSDEEVDAMIGVADVDQDGRVDMQEFISWVFGGQDNSAGKFAAELQKNLSRVEVELEKSKVMLKEKEKELEEVEEQYEEESAAVLSFWKSVAVSSATQALSTVVDLHTKELLGSGNYGFVFKCKRQGTEGSVVVKLMSVRWAHVAVKEWQHGSFAGKHPNIVDYEQVMLHADDDKDISQFLTMAYASGAIKAKTKRTRFPDHYLCLIEEFMNRGTVQHWIDKGMLTPENLLTVIRDIAIALAFMHKNGLTHNDIKPENVLLAATDSEITVKLADLGLANKTDDRSNDFSQFGMTVWCMATGVRFGERKFDPSIAEDLVKELEELTGDSGKEAGPLSDLPKLLRSVWAGKVSMEEISQYSWLQGFKFSLDGDSEVAEDESKKKYAEKGAKLARRGSATHLS